VIEWGSDRSRVEQLIAVGLDPEMAVNLELHDGINAARATINLCEFDEAGCKEGIKVLKLYRWEWDERLAAFKTGVERHDVNSHGAAAFRYLGTSWRELPPTLAPKPELVKEQVMEVSEDGQLTMAAPKASEIIAIRKRLKEMAKQ
jgi:hypothetical protein